MIYNNEDNPTVKIVEFGHGSVKICPTNDPVTMVANGVSLMHSEICQPLGTLNPQDAGKSVLEFDNSVLLLFKKIESIDVLIEELMIVKRGMIEGKSVQEITEE